MRSLSIYEILEGLFDKCILQIYSASNNFPMKPISVVRSLLRTLT